MTLDTSFGPLFNAATGVLVAAIGAWVASVKPRQAGNVAFGVFAMAWGLSLVPNNLIGNQSDLLVPGRVAEAALLAIALCGLYGVARALPQPIGVRDKGMLRGLLVAWAGPALVWWFAPASYVSAPRSDMSDPYRRMWSILVVASFASAISLARST